MIDHIGIPVGNIARATEFYLKALAPLGISRAARTTALPACVPTTTPIITEPSCSIPTATISRPSVAPALK
jgi:catechol 2,3-dioxygenase-like lactoylglutathione lyase family enzyme